MDFLVPAQENKLDRKYVRSFLHNNNSLAYNISKKYLFN